MIANGWSVRAINYRTARNNHKCQGCGGVIPKGSTYALQEEFRMEEREITRTRTFHVTCPGKEE